MSRKPELSHVVYSGWMIKSPPEKKLTGPWKIFRAKWKRRYFVLSKPAQSLPGTFLLHYFSDENCKRLKGYIDLEQCAEIIENLDSDQFQYLFAIKTTHKGRDRTYFLATDTEEQMSTWVSNLCWVCGMKPDESGSDAEGSPKPPVREELPRKTQLTQPTPTTMAPSHVGVMTKPNISSTLPANRNSPSTKARSGVTLSKSTVAPKSHANERESEYLPLSDCTSGPSIKRTERQISVDSVPEDFAPPPPVRKGGGHEDRESEVFGTVGSVSNSNMLYDVPPTGKHDEDDEDDSEVYKVPPRPSRETSNLEPYDILPPHHSPSTPRSSSSESQKVDSAYSSQGFYDIPPTRAETLTQDEVYDIPPSHNDRLVLDDTPPVRPPKPSHLQTSSQEPYMNIPSNSRLLAGQSVDINSVVLPQAVGMTKMDPADLYDFPRSASIDNHNNNIVHSDKIMQGMVPPPNSCGQREHKYMNAYHGIIDEGPQDVYLAMAPVPNAKPRKSSSTDNEVEYTDMSGRSDFDDSFEGKTVYDHPPPSRPTFPPPRPSKPNLSDVTQDTYSIFSTTRTRSFKKTSEGSPSVKRRSPTSPSVQTSSVKVPLPQRSMDRHPDFSTSDEDDDDMGSPDVWETTVPAPTNKDTELKYVDLDHDEDKEPARSPHPVASSQTPTEYHEIDFVKTTVLQNLKEQRNKKSTDGT